MFRIMVLWRRGEHEEALQAIERESDVEHNVLNRPMVLVFRALLPAKGWGHWLQKAGAATFNPFAAIEPVGKPKAGTSQLTRDEAQRCVSLPSREQRRFTSMPWLCCGGCTWGCEGHVLIIPFGQTASARRRLKVPAGLQPSL